MASGAIGSTNANAQSESNLEGVSCASKDRWRRERIRFRYRIGTLPLFSVSLEAQVDDEHFSRSSADSIPPPAEARDFGPEVEVRLRQSQPVKSDPPLLELRGKTLRYAPERYWRHYIELSGSFEDYRQRALSPKSRSTVGRKVRRFADHVGGPIRWREFCRPEEMAEFDALARAVSVRTYQEKLYDAGLPAGAGFGAALHAWAARDQVRGYVLFLAERPIAYLLCPAEGDVLFAQYLGYDPELRRWSPGTVLQFLALERLFTEGRFRVLDFTKGDGQHKAVFATDAVRCADLYDFRLTPKAVLLVAAHAGLASAARLARWALDRMGLKSRVRWWIRSRAVGAEGAEAPAG